jgi:hypothetical protein
MTASPTGTALGAFVAQCRNWTERDQIWREQTFGVLLIKSSLDFMSRAKGPHRMSEKNVA